MQDSKMLFLRLQD